MIDIQHLAPRRAERRRELESTLCMYIITYMKAIQITFDEKLLEELDATDEVRRDGRSAVLRRAVRDYLQRRRRHTIAERYAKAYGSDSALGDEFTGWEDQGRWPDE